MEFLLDSADLDEIKEAFEVFPLAGVTTNPTIIAKSKKEMFGQLRAIRAIIGKDAMLHVQVLGERCDLMLLDAEAIVKEIDRDVYIKVPLTKEGLKAMKSLKKQGYKVTATAVFNYKQSLIASGIGVDYVAPYISRMMRNGIDAYGEVELMATTFKENACSTKILAASFQNSEQMSCCIAMGADCVTAKLADYYEMIEHPLTTQAVKGFREDWQKVYQDKYPFQM
ncbi:MAG: fructose-6-phosphate aldolase [Erysipelotrichaceae bacterium]